MRRRFLLASAALFLFPAVLLAQAGKDKETTANRSAFASSPAYSEILLKRTELESEIESLLLDYTEEHPKLKETRFALAQLENEIKRLNAFKPSDPARYTLALGKLVVKKVEVETELWTLRQQYKEDYPEVKRAKKKAEIFERAIRDILG